MGFIKKNTGLCALILVCLLAFVAGAYLTFAEMGKVDSAQKRINSAEAQLKTLLVADPAPTAANVEASTANVAALESELKKIRENLQRGSRIKTSTDGVGVMAGIQQYISEYQRRAVSHTNAAGEAQEIKTPNNFAFGFEKYIETGVPLKDEAVIATLDKQRQVLSYIVNQLFASDPVSITAVKRELLEVPEGSADAKEVEGFQISSAVSARVPGAIDTMAYRVTFTGYTDSLRVFLNNLSKFELPIVVRSVEVTRPKGSATTANVKKSNSLDDIFGALGGSAASKAEAPKETKKPVISENVSSFTVVLEFIEIVLPSDSEQNPS